MLMNSPSYGFTQVLCAIALPWLAVLLLLLAFFMRSLIKAFLKASRELKRLESTSKSPIFVGIDNLFQVCTPG